MCFLNSGQTCVALSRLLVPRARLAEAEDLAASTAASYTLGNPLDESTSLGPLASAAQRDRVRAYIQGGIDEGAKLVIGGTRPPEGLEKGLLRAPDSLLGGGSRHDDCPRGDLRPGALDHRL